MENGKHVIARDVCGENTRRIYVGPRSHIDDGLRMDYSTGLRIENVWRKKNILIVEFYSIWNNGHGACRGTEYTYYDCEGDEDEILQIAQVAKFLSIEDEIADMIPELV